MNEIVITKDAASLFKQLYALYKKRIKSGQPKREAAIFGDPSDIQKEIRSKRSLEDIEDACLILHNANLLQCLAGDDTLQLIWLSDLGIAYAENRSAGAIAAIWNVIKELLHFIP